MKPNRPAAIFLVVVGLAIIWFALGARQIEKWRFYSFEQDLWSTADDNERWYMAQYLVDKELLLGKTKNEVIDLLGPGTGDGIPMMLYNLGSERGSLFAIDDDWLELMFDGSDRNSLIVVTARIRPD